MLNQLSLFCTDYFFHYLLIHSLKARLCIASYLSGQNVKFVEIVSSERFPGHKDGKKFILDITMKDNLGNLYNIEMQNGYISKSELARFQVYTTSMIDLQIQEGVEYADMKKVHTLIIYTGHPITNFQHLWHEVELMDGRYAEPLYNGMISMSFIQLKRMEELEMEVAMNSEFYQLMRLFEDEKNHEEEQEGEVAKEAVEIYKRYISKEEYILYKEIQRDRLWMKTEISRGKRQGREEGRKEGREEGRKEEKLKRACQLISKKYKIEDLEWLKTCTSEQLDYIFDIIIDDINYEEFKKIICHYSL